MTIKEIEKLLLEHEEDKKLMCQGEAYYRHKNTFIIERKKHFYSVHNNRTLEDFTKANYKLASGYTKLIVDQKINYLINEKTKLDDASKDVLGNKYKRTLKSVGKDASNKMRGVIQWYIENGELKYKKIKPEQIILVYSEENEEDLLYVIRCYTIQGVGKVDVWSADEVNRYKKKDGKLVLVATEPQIVRTTASGSVIVDRQGLSWGRPPFSVLWNNEEHEQDLALFKLHVDMYDMISSDFGNNFDDFGEMYWVLKNYQGQNAQEFIEEFKKSRILKVSGDGDAQGVNQEVPYLARKEFLSLLKQDIYEFAMAVDPKTIKGDSTNLTIEALFYNLDLKANDFETQVQIFFDDCMYFVNRYNEIFGKGKIDGSLTLARERFVNRKDTVEYLLAQRGFRSDKKIMELMPDVEDVEEELALIEEQNMKNTESLETPFEG